MGQPLNGAAVIHAQGICEKERGQLARFRPSAGVSSTCREHEATRRSGSRRRSGGVRGDRLCPLWLTCLLGLPLTALLAFHTPAIAQTAAPSLEISVAELSADGGTIRLTTKNSAFIGADIADIVHRNATYRGYFDNISGAPTSTFRNKIFLAGGPAGMEVSSLTMFPPTQNTNGVGASNHHVLVDVTFSASTSPLASDVPVTLTVHRDLVLFLNSDGTMSGPLVNGDRAG